jgi:hypothetical protein
MVLVVLMGAVKPSAWVCRCWAVRLCSGSLLVSVALLRIGPLPRTGWGGTFGPEFG